MDDGPTQGSGAERYAAPQDVSAPALHRVGDGISELIQDRVLRRREREVMDGRAQATPDFFA